MPDVTYSPNQGRVSRVSAEDQIQSQMQDFLLRKALADQQATIAREGMGLQRDLASDAGTRAERMQATDIGAQRDIQGTFGDRSAAQMGMLDKTIGGQRDIAEIGNRGALDVAREGNAPQMAALDFQRGVYGDKRADDAVRRAIEEAKGRGQLQMMKEIGLPVGDLDAPASGQPVRATSAGTAPPMESRGVPAGGASSLVDAVTTVQTGGDAGPRRAIPGRNQYEFDDKSARDQASMLDQLKGQVDPARWQQAVDQLDNSRRQQGQRQLKQMEVATPPPDQEAVQRVIAGTMRGESEPGKPSFFDRLSPEQQLSVFGQLQGVDIPQDPVKAAQSAKEIADIQGGPLGAIQQRAQQSIAQRELTKSVVESPVLQQSARELARLGEAGNAEKFAAKLQEMHDDLVGEGVTPREAAALIQETAQDAAPSLFSDILNSSSPLQGVFNYFRTGSPFIDRSAVREVANR